MIDEKRIADFFAELVSIDVLRGARDGGHLKNKIR